MNTLLKRVILSISGLLQGTLGSYLALLGYAFAFPEYGPGSKEYEEDMFFVPWGYIIMLIWISVMAGMTIRLRKNKGNLLCFWISWLVGVTAFIAFALIIHKFY